MPLPDNNIKKCLAMSFAVYCGRLIVSKHVSVTVERNALLQYPGICLLALLVWGKICWGTLIPATFCRDGSMALFSLQDGGLLGEYQEAMSDAADQTAAAAAFSRHDKALCAVAYAGSCIIVTSPWRQKPCAVKGCYVCPKVCTVLDHR